MKKAYKVGMLLLACSQQVIASNIEEADFDIDSDVVFLPTYKLSTALSSGAIPFRSSLLEQRHPNGRENQIDDVNQTRGEGLPYGQQVLSLLSQTPKDEKNKAERATADTSTFTTENIQSSANISVSQAEELLKDIFHSLNTDKTNFNVRFLPFFAYIYPPEWHDYIEKILPKVKIIFSDYLVQENTFNSLCLTSSRSAEELLDTTAPFFQNIRDERYKEDVLKIFSRVPLLDRKQLIEDAKLFFKSITEDLFRVKILESIAHLSSLERKQLFDDTEQFLHNVEEEILKCKILLFFAPVTSLDRRQLINDTTPFFKEVKNDVHKANILRIFSGMSSVDRKRLIEEAGSLLQEAQDDWHKISIIETLAALPPSDRKQFDEDSEKALLQKTKNIWYNINPLEFLDKISSLDREKLLEEATPLLLNVSYLPKADILRTLANFSPSERKQFIEDVTPLVQSVSQEGNKVSIIQCFAKVPFSERKQFLRDAVFLLQNVTDERDKADIISSINLFKHKPYLEKIPSICDSLKISFKNEDEKKAIYGALSELDIKDRYSLIEETMPYIKHMVNGYEYAFLIRLSSIYGVERLKSLFKSLKDLTDITDSLQRAYILKLISIFPQEQQQTLFEKVFNYIQQSQTDPFQISNADIEIHNDWTKF